VRNVLNLTEISTLNLTVLRGLRGDSPKDGGTLCAEFSLTDINTDEHSSPRYGPFSQTMRSTLRLVMAHSQHQRGALFASLWPILPKNRGALCAELTTILRERGALCAELTTILRENRSSLRRVDHNPKGEGRDTRMCDRCTMVVYPHV